MVVLKASLKVDDERDTDAVMVAFSDSDVVERSVSLALDGVWVDAVAVDKYEPVVIDDKFVDIAVVEMVSGSEAVEFR